MLPVYKEKEDIRKKSKECPEKEDMSPCVKEMG